MASPLRRCSCFGRRLFGARCAGNGDLLSRFGVAGLANSAFLVLSLRGITVAKASAALADQPARRTASAPRAADEARPQLPQVDELIHERIRLGIVSALAVNDSLTFKEMKALLQTTDGNLSVHARKLEAAGYIVCKKSFERRIPKTEFTLTSRGRKMFEKYLNHMEALIYAMRNP